MASITPPPPNPDTPDPSNRKDEPASAPVKLGFSFFSPIRTHTARVSPGTIFLMSFPWFCVLFNIFVMGTAVTYTIKHYTNDPTIIALVTSTAGLVAIFVGPITSFLSDRIWTPLGRRKPFLMIAWSAVALGTALIPLIPVFGPAVNSVLGSLGIPFIKDFYFLAVIVIGCGSLNSSFSGPLEPLCLEIVPQDQRGRYWAMRTIFQNMASLFFFQLLWPIYDMRVPMLFHSTLGITLTGEQMIYVLASSLFFINTLHLAFNVKETKQESAQNTRIRDIQIWPFVKSFVKDVFGDPRWYPLYLIMVIPGITESVWGVFRNVMQTDQFGYGKDNMGLMGLPSMLIGMAITAPLAGWYSDKKPKLSNLVMGGLILLGATTLWGTFWIYGHTEHPDKLELPSIWIMFAMCLSATISTISFFAVFIEILLKFADRNNMRVWIATLAVVKDAGFTLGMFLLIRYGCTDGVPPITLWMLAGQFGGTTGAIIGVVVGPMIFEFIPSNRFGTVASGAGILSSLIGFATANIGAAWIKWYTAHFGTIQTATGKILEADYSSMYVLQLLLMPIVMGVKIYFLWLVITKRMKVCK